MIEHLADGYPGQLPAVFSILALGFVGTYALGIRKLSSVPALSLGLSSAGLLATSQIVGIDPVRTYLEIVAFSVLITGAVLFGRDCFFWKNLFGIYAISWFAAVLEMLSFPPQRVSEDFVWLLMDLEGETLEPSEQSRAGVLVRFLYSLGEPGEALISIAPLTMLCLIPLLLERILVFKPSSALASSLLVVTIFSAPIFFVMSSYIPSHTLVAIGIGLALSAVPGFNRQKAIQTHWGTVPIGLFLVSFGRPEGPLLSLFLTIVLVSSGRQMPMTQRVVVTGIWLLAFLTGPLPNHVAILIVPLLGVVFLAPKEATKFFQESLFHLFLLASGIWIAFRLLVSFAASIEANGTAVVANLIFGAGGWGGVLPLVLIVAIYGLGVRLSSEVKLWSRLVITSFTLTVSLKLAEGPITSIGFHDSLTRTLFHWVVVYAALLGAVVEKFLHDVRLMAEFGPPKGVATLEPQRTREGIRLRFFASPTFFGKNRRTLEPHPSEPIDRN